MTKKKVCACVIAILHSLGLFGRSSAIATPAAFGEEFKHKYSTEHFNFYSMDDGTSSKEYGNFLEDFLVYLERNLTALPSGWPVDFYILDDEQSLNVFLKKKLGEYRNVRGAFYPKYNAMFTSKNGGLGTTAHELMHKIVGEKFRELEPWAKEGIPSFFEKIYGYRDKSGPVFYLGYENPWRLQQLGNRLTTLTIEQIVSDGTKSDMYYQSERRMLSTFLFHEGKLKKYFSLAVSNTEKHSGTLLEAALGESMSSADAKFSKFTSGVNTSTKRLLNVPSSKYCRSKQEFENFYNVNRDALRPVEY